MVISRITRVERMQQVKDVHEAFNLGRKSA